VDGKVLATFSNPPYQTWWTLSAGNHQFWMEGVKNNGEIIKSDVAVITVLANP
jgi:hypothetical protein